MMPLRVLISGAGIAGPTLACFLAKTGARITIVEKSYALLPMDRMWISKAVPSLIQAMFSIMPRNASQEKEWENVSRGDRKAQGELLRKEFADAGWQIPRVLDAMDQAPEFYFHPMQQIKMTKWSTLRVICLGAAAYAPSPLTEMGISLAIIGAYVLAGELSKLNDSEHFSGALEAYENAFSPFVEEMQEIPLFVPAIAHPETKFTRWLLQTFLSVLSKIVERFSPNFGGGVQSENFALPENLIFNSKREE